MYRFRFAAIVLACLAFSGSAFAQAGSRDETYEEIIKNRDAFKRVVHMRGDSFMRGYGLGFFPDVATEEQRDTPHWQYRSPASTFNAFAPPGITAGYAGASGQPDDFQLEDVITELRAQIRDGIIRPDDVVVLEDAGLQYGSPREYLKNWRRLRYVLSQAQVKLVFVTVPDRIKGETFGGVSAALYSFNHQFAGLSHNDAIRIAAENDTLVDLARLVDAAEKEGRTPMHRDMIHINVEGQCVLVKALFEKLSIKANGDCLSYHPAASDRDLTR